MPTYKHKDWNGWLDGMRSKVFRAGAEALVTSLTAMFGTNAVANMHIPGFEGIGMTWKTAIASLLIQFVVRVVIAAAMYVQAKPDPDVIVETVETTLTTKTETTTTAGDK
jgi:hypothetical protein